MTMDKMAEEEATLEEAKQDMAIVSLPEGGEQG